MEKNPSQSDIEWSLGAHYNDPDLSDDLAGVCMQLWKYTVTHPADIKLDVRMAKWASTLRWIPEAGGNNDGTVSNVGKLYELCYLYSRHEHLWASSKASTAKLDAKVMFGNFEGHLETAGFSDVFPDTSRELDLDEFYDRDNPGNIYYPLLWGYEESIEVLQKIIDKSKTTINPEEFYNLINLLILCGQNYAFNHPKYNDYVEEERKEKNAYYLSIFLLRYLLWLFIKSYPRFGQEESIEPNVPHFNPFNANAYIHNADLVQQTLGSYAWREHLRNYKKFIDWVLDCPWEDMPNLASLAPDELMDGSKEIDVNPLYWGELGVWLNAVGIMEVGEEEEEE